MRWISLILCSLLITGCAGWRLVGQSNDSSTDLTTKQARELVGKAQQAVQNYAGWQAKLHIENADKKENLEVACVKEDVSIRYISDVPAQQYEMVFVKEKAPYLFVKAGGKWSKETVGSDAVSDNFQMLCELANPTYVLQGLAKDSKNKPQLTQQGDNWIIEVKVSDQDTEIFGNYLGKRSRDKLETANHQETISYRLVLNKGSHQVQKIERREETKDSPGKTSIFFYHTDEIVEAKGVRLSTEVLQAPLSGDK
ncbi:hypothetical protein J2Z48_002565 [Croceifilum oryzae]|uniref:Outer membrane lipoprotein-sorting protein n=1 Tax=Croceifilum oryzae TaxID=1553429 RepID=A0AAJ1WTG5_9BACL|nr:hypothetical protein [Croceifilum oryzae]MDQ0418373.1 hypothetical protein [Croceifilum oryzae]